MNDAGITRINTSSSELNNGNHKMDKNFQSIVDFGRGLHIEFRVCY